MKCKEMNRTITIVALILAALFVAGCGKSSQCNNSHWTPSGIDISWTDYNSVEKVVEYFNCHDSTIMVNKGKELKVYGYIKHNMFGTILCPDTNESSCFIPMALLEGISFPQTDSTRKYYVCGRVYPIVGDASIESFMPCCKDIITFYGFKILER